jgi:hypothetical protein
MMKYVIIGLVIASLVGVITAESKYILNQNTIIAEQRLTIEATNKAIEEATAAYAREKVARNELATKLNESEGVRNDLAELLSRHDLERIAKAKPSRLEDIINEATKQKLEAFRQFGRR